jgi:hypothetical protein
VTSASPSSPRTSAGSDSQGGGGSGSSEGSGFRGSGGRRVTIFTVTPQILVTAVSTASAAISGLQKKRTKKKNPTPSENATTSGEQHVASSMNSDQEQTFTQEEGKQTSLFYNYKSS